MTESLNPVILTYHVNEKLLLELLTKRNFERKFFSYPLQNVISPFIFVSPSFQFSLPFFLLLSQSLFTDFFNFIPPNWGTRGTKPNWNYYFTIWTNSRRTNVVPRCTCVNEMHQELEKRKSNSRIVFQFLIWL